MLVENADDQTPADPSLLRIIARAHHIQARLIQNPKLTWATVGYVVLFGLGVTLFGIVLTFFVPDWRPLLIAAGGMFFVVTALSYGGNLAKR
jgi:hypothetical protein